MASFCRQTWTLASKDLRLAVQKRWFSTFVRAIAFPIVLTVIISQVKNWISSGHGYGIGSPSNLLSLSEAFNYVGDTRSKFVIIDRQLPQDDVRRVIRDLTLMAKDGHRNVQVISNVTDLQTVCPGSNRGYTPCFAAVDFYSSPQQATEAIWNYTIYQDNIFGGVNVRGDRNNVQVYTMPLQHAIDSLIANVSGRSPLPAMIRQYPFTRESQAHIDERDRQNFTSYIELALAFALFLALCGIAYHLTGHVVRQREEGLLELIDAMMPSSHAWQRPVARILATHIAFDIIYLPSWIVCGAVTGSLIFSSSNAGWFILMYVLAGLAMTSFAILASALFRRTQLAAISAVVAAVSLAIVAQYALSPYRGALDEGVIATGILFPPCSFVFFLVASSVLESNQLSVTQGNRLPPPEYNYGSPVPHQTDPLIFFAFFAFQILVFPALAWFIEKSLWGCSARGRYSKTSAEMNGCAIRLVNFSKQYKKAVKKRDRTHAVNDLSLDLYAGSITMLLGANGSGKSTTLNCIAGTLSVTNGSIEIDGSGGVGLCPQKNVLWADMTVYEHVHFFQRLKAPLVSSKATKLEVDRLIRGCDLVQKVHARSKTLSGGQMRKLQLALMLAGGSKVCCIDEASSGIDPLARRKIWDILIKERGQRTLLMTTHFLDESEVLADHIALLSKGELRTQGSVAALKSMHGDGYQVTTTNDAKEINLQHMPSSIRREESAMGHSFRVEDRSDLPWLMDRLEQSGTLNYHVRGPTIETVFLKLSDEMKPNLDNGRNLSGDMISHQPMILHPGKGCSPLQQTVVLFLKRLTVLKHNFMPYVVSLFVPLTIAGLVVRFLANESATGLQCQRGDGPVNIYAYSKPASVVADALSNHLVLGPPNIISSEQIVGLIPNATFYSRYSTPRILSDTVNVTSEREFDAAIRSFQPDRTEDDGIFVDSVGGIFLNQTSSPLFAWETEGTYSSIPPAVLLQAAMNMRLMNMSLAVSYQTFASGYTPGDYAQSLVAVFTVLGFALYPGLFALYPTAERLRKVRAMHYSNGITSGPVWTAYAAFDFCFLLLISVLVTVIWATTYPGWYALGHMFVVFLLYGMASTAYAYAISLFVTSQLAAMALASIVQVIISILFFVGCFLTVDMTEPQMVARQLNVLFFTIGLICPGVSLMRAIFMALNIYSSACQGSQLASFPGGITRYGGPILYLVMQFLLIVLFLIYWESGRTLHVFSLRRRREDVTVDSEKNMREARYAIEDHTRLSADNQGLRVEHISKTFGKNLAVDDVSFGILPSEKFALLGPNGAGKSTTISLIREEIFPDATNPAGEIHISGDSLMRAPLAARQHLGVCPQFDAVDAMTLSEHLHFYARARGVTGQQKEENIREIVARLGLQDHVHKLVKKLSGGTKRKLSLAIALIANPSVLLLDEPSSGMDAVAKRALWDTLQSISAGRSLLITTHSMEEADALCDRAGIMAGKMLALGTIDELHKRHGDRVFLQMIHEDAPQTSEEEIDDTWRWVRSTFAVAETERAIRGHFRFTVPTRRNSATEDARLDGGHLGNLYRAIESEKQRLRIAEYAVGPATLDQVFMNVVTQHRVSEENAEPTPSRSFFRRRKSPRSASPCAVTNSEDEPVVSRVTMESLTGKE